MSEGMSEAELYKITERLEAGIGRTGFLTHSHRDTRDLIAEIRRLTGEVERLKREGTVQIEVSEDGIVMTGSAARQIGPTTYVMTATQFSGEAAEE